jgi:hypothetical protein
VPPSSLLSKVVKSSLFKDFANTRVLIVNIVIVIGSPTLEQSMRSKFANETTSLGEEINIVQIEKPEGVAGPDEVFQQHAREQVIKEYFFGDARRTLSPQIQQMDFDGLVIYRTSGRESNFLFVAVIFVMNSFLA